MENVEAAVAKLLKDSRNHYPYAEIVPTRDIGSIAALGKLCFGRHSFTVKKFKSLLEINPNILWRVKGRNNTTEGYLDILPVKAAFADGLIAGTKRESDLQPSDVIAENQIPDDPDGVIYIAGFVIPGALQTNSRAAAVSQVAAKLVVAALDRIQYLFSRSSGFSRVVIMPYQRGEDSRWSTVPYLTKFGFKQAGQSGERFPVFQLNLNEPHDLTDMFVSIGKRREAAAHWTRTGKSKKNADKVLGFLKSADVVNLAEKTIVGEYRRFDEQTINSLKARVREITDALEKKRKSHENFLIWAAPGTGKTYFIQQIAHSLGAKVAFVPIDFAKMNRGEVVDALGAVANDGTPALVLYDEIDAKEGENWPYDVSFRSLDLNKEDEKRCAVFVLIGSKATGLKGMVASIRRRPKGTDLIDRVPELHWFEIPPMTVGDRAIVMSSQIKIAAAERNLNISQVDKLAAYYVLSDAKRSPRQVTALVQKAVRRMPPAESTLAFDYFFERDDPRQFRFWASHGDVLNALQYTKLTLT